MTAEAICACFNFDKPVGYGDGTLHYSDQELADNYKMIADGSFLPEDNAEFFQMAEVQAAWFVLMREHGAMRAREIWEKDEWSEALMDYIDKKGGILRFPAERARAIQHMHSLAGQKSLSCPQ